MVGHFAVSNIAKSVDDDVECPERLMSVLAALRFVIVEIVKVDGRDVLAMAMYSMESTHEWRLEGVTWSSFVRRYNRNGY